MARNFNYTYDSEANENLSHKQIVLFYSTPYRGGLGKTALFIIKRTR